jgi:hypothetical protein
VKSTQIVFPGGSGQSENTENNEAQAGVEVPKVQVTWLTQNFGPNENAFFRKCREKIEISEYEPNENACFRKTKKSRAGEKQISTHIISADR